MPEDLNAAVSSLDDQTKKYNLALNFVGGDMELARQMIAGTYKDIYAIKCLFSSSSLYGAFLLFYNFVYLKLLDPYLIVTPAYSIQNIDPADDWCLFEKEISEHIKAGEYDDVLGRSLRDRMNTSFTLLFITDLNKCLKSSDDISLGRLYQRMIQDALGLQRIDVNIHNQLISSLDLELKSTSTRKIDLNAIESQKAAAAAKKEAEAAVEAIERDEIPKVGEDGIKLILNSSLILSPIKGKDISTLVPGDRVMLSIVDNDSKAISVAKAFNAYQDNKITPITGRIKMIKNTPEGYYE